MISEYIEYDPGTEYDIVQLLVALELKESHQPIYHDWMTTVIQYNTPYIINNTSPLIIFFAIGTNVAIHSIFSIHCH